MTPRVLHLFGSTFALMMWSCGGAAPRTGGSNSDLAACIEDQPCDDGDVCTEGERCRGGRCSGGQPVACDDGLWCNGQERCVAGQGCVHENLPSCADAIACTDDRCDEGADRCTNPPAHAQCGVGAWCNPFVGCEPVRTCLEDSECDDGFACNGAERCSGAFCAPGEPLVCDDGRQCTDDVCDEAQGGCAHAPVHARCGDAVFCNGEDLCDPSNADADSVTGCTSAAPIPCPSDDCRENARCDEALDACVWTPKDNDGDGAGSAACGGTDCDDTDPARRPGASETCDYQDQDCDGAVDEGFEYGFLQRNALSEERYAAMGSGSNGFAVLLTANSIGEVAHLYDWDGQPVGAPRQTAGFENTWYHRPFALPNGRWGVPYRGHPYSTLLWRDFAADASGATTAKTVATLGSDIEFIAGAVSATNLGLSIRLANGWPDFVVVSSSGDLIARMPLSASMIGTPGIAASPTRYALAYERSGSVILQGSSAVAPAFGEAVVVASGSSPWIAWNGTEWVVVWVQNATLSGRRYDEAMNPVGPIVSMATGFASLRRVYVAAAAAGTVAVLWQDGDGVALRRFAADLRPVGAAIGVMSSGSTSELIESPLAPSGGRFGVHYFNPCIGCSTEATGHWFTTIGCSP